MTYEEIRVYSANVHDVATYPDHGGGNPCSTKSGKVSVCTYTRTHVCVCV